MTIHSTRGRTLALVCLLIGAVFGITHDAGAQAFEGIISYDATSNETTSSFDYYVKGTRMRLEVEGPGAQGAAIIIDSESNLATMLVPGSKMYMEFDLSKDLPGRPKTTPESVVLTRTGRTEEIAGQECEEFIASSQSMKAEVWATAGFGNFMQFNPAPKSASPSASLERKLAQQGLFPLRMIVRDLSGVEQSRIEATKIRRQTLENSLFSVPSGWMRMDLNMMPK
jgi:hypothetical protein